MQLEESTKTKLPDGIITELASEIPVRTKREKLIDVPNAPKVITLDFSESFSLYTPLKSIVGPDRAQVFAAILRDVRKTCNPNSYTKYLGRIRCRDCSDQVLTIVHPADTPVPQKYLTKMWASIHKRKFDRKFGINTIDFVPDGPDWRKEFRTKSQLKQGALVFVVPRLIPTEAITGIGGLSGHAKTFIMMSMAKTISRGGFLWGKFKTDQYPVLYLIPESGDLSFHHRMNLLDIPDTRHFLVRTMTQGATLSLSSETMLKAVKGRVVFLDTLPRFTEGRDEQQARDMVELSQALLGLLQAGAVAVVFAHHSPKSSRKETTMDLENVFRGSGDIGAIMSAGHGIRMLDVNRTLIQVECVKARDFEPLKPFQLEGRPWIDEESDFHMVKAPGKCNTLAEEQNEKAVSALTAKILAVIKKKPGLSGNKICIELGANRNSVYTALSKGKGKYWIESDGYFEIE